MKRQQLTIAPPSIDGGIDRRKTPPDVRRPGLDRARRHFTDHASYLAAMSQIMQMNGCHQDEVTTSTVTLFPENQAGLFEDEKA